MKNYFFVLVFITIKNYSCDMCGAFMGLTPYDNNSQISILHRYRVFNGYVNYQQRSSFLIPGAYKTAHDPYGQNSDSSVVINKYSSKDYETFKIFELRGKYFLHRRIELNFILPFQQIKTKYDTEKNSVFGISDPSIFCAYHLIKKIDNEKFKQRLLLGAGAKLPIGDENRLDKKSLRLFLTTQLGTGSFDNFYYINYICNIKKFGFNVNSMVKFNGKNKFQEQYKPSFNQILSLFYKFQLKNTTVFTSVLANYEFSNGLIIQNKLLSDTKINVLLLGPSIDVVFNKLTLNASYQFNAYERVSSHALSNAGRFVIGVTYNFNQNKYLIK
jgi:hypothetical protein